MFENSGSPGGVGRPQGPLQLGGVPHSAEDNARKRFRLEQERRRAEKNPKEPTDREDPHARDRWDGERHEGEPEAEVGPRPDDARTTEPPRGQPGKEGGLDVVA